MANYGPRSRKINNFFLSRSGQSKGDEPHINQKLLIGVHPCVRQLVISYAISIIPRIAQATMKNSVLATSTPEQTELSRLKTSALTNCSMALAITSRFSDEIPVLLIRIQAVNSFRNHSPRGPNRAMIATIINKRTIQPRRKIRVIAPNLQNQFLLENSQPTRCVPRFTS
jgi:hypothetical protein